MNAVLTLITALKEQGMEQIADAIENDVLKTSERIADVEHKVNDATIEAMTERNYPKAIDILKIQLLIEPAKSGVHSIVEPETLELEPETEEDQPAEENAEETNMENSGIDESERHPLSDDVTFSKPYAFELNGEKHRLAKQEWKALYRKVCEEAIKMDEKVWNDYVERMLKRNMTTLRIRRFAEEGYQQIGNTHYFVKCDVGAERIREEIIELLKEYGLENKCYIYWTMKEKPVEKPEIEANEKLRVGTKVQHTKLGRGIVEEVNEEAVRIRFSGDDIRRIKTEEDGTSPFLKVEQQ